MKRRRRELSNGMEREETSGRVTQEPIICIETDGEREGKRKKTSHSAAFPVHRSRVLAFFSKLTLPQPQSDNEFSQGFTLGVYCQKTEMKMLLLVLIKNFFLIYLMIKCHLALLVSVQQPRVLPKLSVVISICFCASSHIFTETFF